MDLAEDAPMSDGMNRAALLAEGAKTAKAIAEREPSE